MMSFPGQRRFLPVHTAPRCGKKPCGGSRSGSDHETGTEASSQAGEVKTELERILRYTAHAEEAFAEGDHSLAREWLTEIRDALKALIG